MSEITPILRLAEAMVASRAALNDFIVLIFKEIVGKFIIHYLNQI